MATTESANLHVQTVEMIRRFGGSTSGNDPWPRDRDEGNMDDDDGSERLELLAKIAQKISNKITKIADNGNLQQSHTRGSGSSLRSTQSQELRLWMTIEHFLLLC